MPWERRRNSGKSFFYLAQRRGKKVVKQYLGRAGDPVVELLAKQDRLQRAERKAIQQASQAVRIQYQRVEAFLVHVNQQVNALIRAEMSERGYRWSKVNGGKKIRGINMKTRNGTEFPVTPMLTRDDFDALVERAEDGDDDSLQQLRVVLRQRPEIAQRIGNLSSHVQDLLLGLVAGKSVVARESLNLQAEQMHQELGGKNPSPLEQLLIERIITSWIDLQLNQIASAEPRESSSDSKFWEQRLERAQRRHFQAIQEFVKLRKLLG